MDRGARIAWLRRTYFPEGNDEGAMAADMAALSAQTAVVALERGDASAIDELAARANDDKASRLAARWAVTNLIKAGAPIPEALRPFAVAAVMGDLPAIRAKRLPDEARILRDVQFVNAVEAAMQLGCGTRELAYQEVGKATGLSAQHVKRTVLALRKTHRLWGPFLGVQI